MPDFIADDAAAIAERMKQIAGEEAIVVQIQTMMIVWSDVGDFDMWTLLLDHCDSARP